MIIRILPPHKKAQTRDKRLRTRMIMGKRSWLQRTSIAIYSLSLSLASSFQALPCITVQRQTHCSLYRSGYRWWEHCCSCSPSLRQSLVCEHGSSRDLVSVGARLERHFSQLRLWGAQEETEKTSASSHEAECDENRTTFIRYHYHSWWGKRLLFSLSR